MYKGGDLDKKRVRHAEEEADEAWKMADVAPDRTERLVKGGSYLMVIALLATLLPSGTEYVESGS